MKTTKTPSKKPTRYAHLSATNSRRLDRAVAALNRARKARRTDRIGKAEVDEIIAYGAMYCCQRIRAGVWHIWHVGSAMEAGFVIRHLRARDEARLRAEATMVLNTTPSQIRQFFANSHFENHP